MAEAKTKLERIVVEEEEEYGCELPLEPVLDRLAKAGYTRDGIPGGTIHTPGPHSPPLNEIFTQAEIDHYGERGRFICVESDRPSVELSDCSDLLVRDERRPSVALGD